MQKSPRKNKVTKVVLLTGMSGAGKSVTIDIFEDMGYYAIDNLPPSLIEDFLRLLSKSKDKKDKILIVGDIRGGSIISELIDEFLKLQKRKIDVSLLFLDANDKILSKRYSETRRQHPLKGKSLISSLKKERALLEPLRKEADYIIDTSNKNLSDLNVEIHNIFNKKKTKKFEINILSFGYKYGLPIYTDFIFDMRFIKNPYYKDELRSLTGKDKAVFAYIFSKPIAKDFFKKVVDMIMNLKPAFEKEQKNSLDISFGCTGGQHRSVAMAIAVYKELKKRKENVAISHREI
jgi:UPF0042 nucleotide-binding protein